MTDVPTISITHDDSNNNDENDLETSPKPNINECHTDVEDLDSDQDKNTLISVLKQNMKTNGAVTDVEDYDAPDDSEESSESDYGPEISLSEYLDQACIDESLNVGDNENKNAVHSQPKRPSVSAFNLEVANNFGGVTDCEDVEASDDDFNDNDEKVYSDDDKAIVLEGSNAVDIHDSVANRKKYVSKNMEQLNSSSSESECVGEKPRLRLKSHKHFNKRNQRCEDSKSDVENIFLPDDDDKRKKSTALPLETPEVEIMAFDGSDHDDEGKTETNFPEINISFAAEQKASKKKAKKKRSNPISSSMLGLPDNEDEGHTDVEKLNSSDDDDDEDQNFKTNSKNLIPIAFIKSDALTDVEDFEDESGEDGDDSDDKLDISLPSPVREIMTLVENKNGEPSIQTKPLPDNVLLGFQDLDADKGLTDVEDFSDESDDNVLDVIPEYDMSEVPDIDGGVIESTDSATRRRGSSLAASVTPDPITDTEDIFMKNQHKGQECRRRKGKSKNSQQKPKSNFLDTKFYVDLNASGHTDVEDLDVEEDDVLLKDKSYKSSSTDPETYRKASTSNADAEESLKEQQQSKATEKED